MTKNLYLEFPEPDRKLYKVSTDKETIAGRLDQYNLNLSEYFSGPLNRLSRTHFKIFYKNGRFIIVDTSSHGTWVNNKRLTKNKDRSLVDGDEIMLANTNEFVIKVSIKKGTDETEPIPISSDFAFVMEQLRNSENIILLGMAGMGKTTLLRNLIPQPETESILGQYLPGHNHLLFCYINCMAIDDYSVPSFFRLFIDTTKPAFKEWPAKLRDSSVTLSRPDCSPGKVKIAMLETIQTVYDELQHKRIVFLLDQFDDVYDELPSKKVFSILKELNASEPKPIYVIAMRNEFELDNSDIHQFLRDFKVTHWLEPLTTSDRLDEVIRSFKLDTRRRNIAIALGSKQPRLTELVAALLKKMPEVPETEEEIIKRVLANNLIADHCEEMWKSLLPDEQVILQSVAVGMRPTMTEEMEERLTKTKLLLVYQNQEVKFENSLFGAYITSPQEKETGLTLDETGSYYKVDGQWLPRQELTPLEDALLSYLHKNAGKVCTYEKIVVNVWDPDSKELITSDKGSIARVISSLRKKLNQKSLGAGERYIETLRDRGYQLTVN